MTERVRFTIAVDPEVYDAFAELAVTSGVSLSRCIGDWLRDTAEAAQMTTIKLQEVRRTPQEAMAIFMREGMVPEMERIGPEVRRFRDEQAKRAAAGRVGAAGAAGGVPPSSNTGGKSPAGTREAPPTHQFPYDLNPTPTSLRMKASKLAREMERACKGGRKP